MKKKIVFPGICAAAIMGAAPMIGPAMAAQPVSQATATSVGFVSSSATPLAAGSASAARTVSAMATASATATSAKASQIVSASSAPSTALSTVTASPSTHTGISSVVLHSEDTTGKNISSASYEVLVYGASHGSWFVGTVDVSKLSQLASLSGDVHDIAGVTNVHATKKPAGATDGNVVTVQQKLNSSAQFVANNSVVSLMETKGIWSAQSIHSALLNVPSASAKGVQNITFVNAKNRVFVSSTVANDISNASSSKQASASTSPLTVKSMSVATTGVVAAPMISFKKFTAQDTTTDASPSASDSSTTGASDDPVNGPIIPDPSSSTSDSPSSTPSATDSTTPSSSPSTTTTAPSSPTSSATSPSPSSSPSDGQVVNGGTVSKVINYSDSAQTVDFDVLKDDIKNSGIYDPSTLKLDQTKNQTTGDTYTPVPGSVFSVNNGKIELQQDASPTYVDQAMPPVYYVVTDSSGNNAYYGSVQVTIKSQNTSPSPSSSSTSTGNPTNSTSPSATSTPTDTSTNSSAPNPTATETTTVPGATSTTTAPGATSTVTSHTTTNNNTHTVDAIHTDTTPVVKTVTNDNGEKTETHSDGGVTTVDPNGTTTTVTPDGTTTTTDPYGNTTVNRTVGTGADETYAANKGMIGGSLGVIGTGFAYLINIARKRKNA